MSDDYAELGELHDLFMVETWERLRPHLHDEFGGLGPEAVIVDIGAGSGMGTRVLAQESKARVVAPEPSLLMRTVLTARVADSADLASRVTVLAGGVPDGLGLLPTMVDGGVCGHMLGGLDGGEREALFAWFGQHLTRDGSVLVTVQEAGSPPPDGDDQPAAVGAGADVLGSDAPAESSELVVRRTLGELEYHAIHGSSVPGDVQFALPGVAR